MIKKIALLLTILLFSNVFASNHGIYLLTVANVKGDINKVGDELKTKLKNAGYNAFMYALPKEVTGANPLEAPGRQTIGLKMSQWQLEVGYAFSF